jgi:hypothetical protein
MEPKRYDFFISFIHDEILIANGVKALIELTGRSVFMSSASINAGQDWLDEIRTAMEHSKAVLLFLSPVSVKKSWVNFEAGAAWLAQRTILPICYGGLGKGDLPEPYRSLRLQAIDVKTDFPRLLEALDHAVPRAPMHVDPIVLARVLQDIFDAAHDPTGKFPRTLSLIDNIEKHLQQLEDLAKRVMKSHFPTTGNFGSSSQSVATSLGVTNDRALEVLEHLEKKGLLRRSGEHWYRKTDSLHRWNTL